MQLTYNVRNTHRAVGTGLSAEITRIYGMKALHEGHVRIRLRGSAGQSLGRIPVPGDHARSVRRCQRLCRQGPVRRHHRRAPDGQLSPLVSHANTIIGNTVLYGATAGKLFAAGQAGERFAVRNSGADVVVEGCGANGCEYMTGGVAVILGETGQQLRRRHDRRHGLCARPA
jgi:glutamate synthase (NADPH/NADH) large chain